MITTTIKKMGGRASTRCLVVVALCGMSVPTSPAFAHHSTAMYNYSLTKVLNGTVRQFQWTNPHSFIQIVVTNSKGKLEEWSIECGAPTTMSMTGWSRDSLKIGDKVKISLAPLRDGSNGGTLRHVTLANGKVLHGAADNLKSDALGRPSGINLPTLPKK
ncbi:hypothetical protein WSK_3225 [Novosphingobium sp. Rr 2-17]|uniref:DUF6152 family protein n=1 Tax=Novosphingobium sp. Rr 2-17 TaxID=555793 RepID=UPI00026988D1|nr:DUF6152 family protein [Novosphingobium sp. Rr 2-17]EIZ78204.1 hypothetical protein WSK_3225 [Novosphingobium sp. Rr 2-17]